MMIHEIEPRGNPNQEHIAFWENFLTPEDINWLLARPEWHNQQVAEIGGQNETGVVNNQIRRTNISWLHKNTETEFFWNRISHAVGEVNRRFFNFDLRGCYEPMQLGVYSEKDQGTYNWHTDSGMRDASVPRKLSMAMLLSDPSEFEGGEFQVKTSNDDPITLEQKKGRAWFFPSYTLHRVAPVTKGVRRSLVLWIGGPPFK